MFTFSKTIRILCIRNSDLCIHFCNWCSVIIGVQSWCWIEDGCCCLLQNWINEIQFWSMKLHFEFHSGLNNYGTRCRILYTGTVAAITFRMACFPNVPMGMEIGSEPWASNCNHFRWLTLSCENPAATQRTSLTALKSSFSFPLKITLGGCWITVNWPAPKAAMIFVH